MIQIKYVGNFITKTLLALFLLLLGQQLQTVRAAGTIDVSYTDLGKGFGQYEITISSYQTDNLYRKVYLEDGRVFENKINTSAGKGSFLIKNPYDGKLITKIEFILKNRETGAVVTVKGGVPIPPPAEGGSTTDPDDPEGGDTTNPGGGSTDPDDPEGGDTTNPGGGSTDPDDPEGGDTNDTCLACELLSCPGWEDIADMFAKEIGKKIPPPPDWEEVADIFGDELVPRMGREIMDEFVDRGVPAIGKEITDVLENVLQHPDPPHGILVPIPPEMNGTEGLSKPQPTDSAPPAQNITFDSVPDIPVTPDSTGGIDLSRADPIDSIPHTSPEYKPMPGKEIGGVKPQTRPDDKPVPSLPAPQVTSPVTSSPGTGTPKPEANTTPPPKPEMPMP